MFRQKNIHYVIIPLLLLLNLSTYFYLNRGNQITAPDLIQNNFFSDVFSKTYKLETCQFNFGLDNIFGTRGLRITKYNCVSHGSMHGLIVLLGIFKAVSNNIQNFAIPLCVFIFLIYLYNISLLLFNNKRTSTLIVFFAFFFPNIFLHSNLLFNNIPETAFFLGFLYYSLQYNRNKRTRELILGLIFFFISFRMRYIVLIFALPVFFLYLRKIKYKHIIVGFLTTVVFMAPFLTINYRLFGNIIGSPKSSLASVQYYNSNVAGVSGGIGIKYFFNVQILDFFTKNLYNHFIFLYPYLFLFLCLLIIDMGIRRKRTDQNIYNIIAVITLVFVFYYIGVWGGV